MTVHSQSRTQTTSNHSTMVGCGRDITMHHTPPLLASGKKRWVGECVFVRESLPASLARGRVGSSGSRRAAEEQPPPTSPQIFPVYRCALAACNAIACSDRLGFEMGRCFDTEMHHHMRIVSAITSCMRHILTSTRQGGRTTQEHERKARGGRHQLQSRQHRGE